MITDNYSYILVDTATYDAALVDAHDATEVGEEGEGWACVVRCLDSVVGAGHRR